MESDTEKTINLLLRKYELIWGAHIHQNELTHRRLGLLWLIQAALFAGLYIAFEIPNIRLGYIVGVSSMAICLIWFFLITRSRASSLLREQALRDVEYQLKSLENENKKNKVEIDLWIVDKKCMRTPPLSERWRINWLNFLLSCIPDPFKKTESHEWCHAPDDEKEKFELIRRSERVPVNHLFKFLPILLLFIWLIVILKVVPSILDP